MSASLSGSSPSRFDKYSRWGAYHWVECDRKSPNFNPPLVARYQVLADALPAACDDLLDVGCGDGYLMGRIASRCKRVVGIDLEGTGVRLAREKLHACSNCTVLRGDCCQLPFRAHHFDVVVMADVIEHLEQPSRCLGEIARVLRPRGRLLVTTPKYRPDRRWDTRHIKEFTPQELGQCLAEHFAEVALRYFWPLRWSNAYATRFGWWAIKWLVRYAWNPFLRQGGEPSQFGQILAQCERPKISAEQLLEERA